MQVQLLISVFGSQPDVPPEVLLEKSSGTAVRGLANGAGLPTLTSSSQAAGAGVQQADR